MKGTGFLFSFCVDRFLSFVSSATGYWSMVPGRSVYATRLSTIPFLFLSFSSSLNAIESASSRDFEIDLDFHQFHQLDRITIILIENLQTWIIHAADLSEKKEKIQSVTRPIAGGNQWINNSKSAKDTEEAS